MILLVLSCTALAALALALAARRGLPYRLVLRPRPLGATDVALGLAATVLMNLTLAAALLDPHPVLSGDLRSHAVIAHQLAFGDALRTGWVDVYHAGFPLGDHYPMIGWLLAAGLMRLGARPDVAANLIACAAVLLTHYGCFHVARRAGLSRWGALAALAVPSWMAPLNGFLGGAQSILYTGVLSQAVAAALLPWLALAIGLVAADRSRARAARRSGWLVALGFLLAVAHPQVAIAALIVLGAAAAAWGRPALRAWAIATAAAALGALGYYGPGLGTLHVPFGWPGGLGWRQTGYSMPMLWYWAKEAELLDFARAPVITSVVAAAAVAALVAARARAVRPVLIACVLAFVGAGAGPWLLGLGKLGALAHTAFQPLRVLVLLPLLAGALVGLGVELARAAAVALFPRAGRAGAAALLLAGAAPLIVMAIAGVPAERRHLAERRRYERAGACGPRTPPGYDRAALVAALRRLHGGRLLYDEPDICECSALRTFDFASAVPIGAPFSAGAHVGMVADAYMLAKPLRRGGAARADALGIRSVLHSRSMPPRSEGWVERDAGGPLAIAERTGGSDYVGYGCVTTAWSGADAAVRAHLFAALQDPGSPVWDPHHFTLLQPGRGPFVETRVREACDPDGVSSLDEPRVHEYGRVEATLVATAPVDVVIRETAFRSWHITLDGRELGYRLVAPGFMAVRVRPGRHVLRAAAAWDTPFVVSFALASALAVLLGALATRRGRRGA